MTFNLPPTEAQTLKVGHGFRFLKALGKNSAKWWVMGRKKELQELNQPLGGVKELKQREGKYTEHPLLALKH